MDWDALLLSLRLAGLTVLLLLPVAVLGGHALARHRFRGRTVVEALVLLPLVLPPTVLGFYLLVAFGRDGLLGAPFEALLGRRLAFSFEGLLLASLLVNLPFAIQPAQRGFEAIPPELLDAARTCGLSAARRLAKIELPLAWPGILTAMVMTFAHTLGEFGVLLMVGGAIPGETKTVAIAIYDRVQAFDDRSAAAMSALLLLLSLGAITLTLALPGRAGRRLTG